MKKIGVYSTLAFMILCISLVAFACRNTKQDYDPEDKAPVYLAAFDEETPASPSTLSLITGLDNPKYLFNATGTTGYYYVEAKAVQAVAEQRKRAPLNLSLVIDRSGSMAGGKLAYAKQAAKHVVDQLGAEDYVSIVIYDDEVQVMSTSNKVGDKNLLKNRIEAIQTGGNTNLSGGMIEGYQQVKSTYRSGYVNRVLLLSDGLANAGITDMAILQRLARDKNTVEGIAISTFGVGLDFNENLMTSIAEHGGGNYYFIDNPEKITSIFQKELNSLLNVVAQNAELKITLPAGVKVLQVYGGQPFQQTGNRVVIRLSDMIAGQSKSALLKFSMTGFSPTVSFKTYLTYVDALSSSKATCMQDATDQLTLTASIEEFGRSFNPIVKSQVVLYESNDNLEKAMQAVDAGRYDEARKLVKDNDSYLQSNVTYVKDNAELQVQMSNNTSYQTQISNVEAIKGEDLKLLQKSNKVMNYDVRNHR